MEATAAMLNNSEMSNGKNSTMSPWAGYFFMALYVIMGIVGLFIAIEPLFKKGASPKKEIKEDNPSEW